MPEVALPVQTTLQQEQAQGTQRQCCLLFSTLPYCLCHHCEVALQENKSGGDWGYASDRNRELLECDRSNLQHFRTFPAIAPPCSSAAPPQHHPAGSFAYHDKTHESLTPKHSSLLAKGCLNGRKTWSQPLLITTRSLQVLSHSDYTSSKILTHGQCCSGAEPWG